MKRLRGFIICVLCSLLLPALPARAVVGCLVSGPPSEAQLARLCPDMFGGLYLKDGKFHVVIVAPTAAEKYQAIEDMKIALAGLDKNEYVYAWRRKGYSLKTLEQEYRRISQWMARNPGNEAVGLRELSIDTMKNQIIVGISPLNQQTVAAFRRLVSSHPAVVPVSVASEIHRPAMLEGQSAIATARVNVRSGPSTAYGKLGQLKRGDFVDVVAWAGRQGEWAVIVWSEGNGYVSRDYIALTGGEIPANYVVPKSDPGDLGIATLTGRVNVRTGPGTQYPILGQLEKGHIAAVWSIAGSWAEITYGAAKDCRAYVSMSYLSDLRE